jgi:hypothetical protein|tara:strand:+ start:359 stop:607 length:249 start_codon:yes stop_codon:yes gene_type:complete
VLPCLLTRTDETGELFGGKAERWELLHRKGSPARGVGEDDEAFAGSGEAIEALDRTRQRPLTVVHHAELVEQQYVVLSGDRL